MPHILVVCTANICRSPVGEALIRDALAQRGFDTYNDWTVDSAGTWATDPRTPSTHSVTLMAERNIDISRMTAQMINKALMQKADLILCMTGNHAEALRVEFPRHVHKIKMFTEIAGRRYDIRDPYGKSLEEYRLMMTELDDLLAEGLDNIIDLAKENAGNRTPL